GSTRTRISLAGRPDLPFGAASLRLKIVPPRPVWIRSNGTIRAPCCANRNRPHAGDDPDVPGGPEVSPQQHKPPPRNFNSVRAIFISAVSVLVTLAMFGPGAGAASAQVHSHTALDFVRLRPASEP